MPVLVDSSLWVHQLRKGGDPAKLAHGDTHFEDVKTVYALQLATVQARAPAAAPNP